MDNKKKNYHHIAFTSVQHMIIYFQMVQDENRMLFKILHLNEWNLWHVYQRTTKKHSLYHLDLIYKIGFSALLLQTLLNVDAEPARYLWFMSI